MPLIAPAVEPETPDPSTPPPSSGGIVLPELGRATVTYYDPTGQAWPLTKRSLGWRTLAEGVSGLGAAPYELTKDPHPRGGVRVRHVQAQERSIVWPLRVTGRTHLDFVGNWRALASAFTRTLRDGPGVLEIARPDGSRRRISVVYQDGWEGLGSYGSGWIADTAVMTLLAEDPYWSDAEPVTVHREQGAGVDFLVPYPSVSSSQVLGATTVRNPGDVTVWPTWQITGPASSITFSRTDTSESFTLDPGAPEVGHGDLLAGQTVTVRTDPVQVRYQDGANWIGALDWPMAVLWGLAPGDNPVRFQLDGAGPGSAVDLVFHPRYETA
ncbi:phage tail family protein [Streptomyces sp. SID8352]|uniref:phage tail family protein n=1 Tax=Streptomyces sp. SID8352 TaxID=2690338 RepID=UPI0013716100|nr:phage tail family protein [Streptomyces sp. SID8352]MYU21191.1 phage tail protein [Streptomyces sp. SID8352]